MSKILWALNLDRALRSLTELFPPWEQLGLLMLRAGQIRASPHGHGLFHVNNPNEKHDWVNREDLTCTLREMRNVLVVHLETWLWQHSVCQPTEAGSTYNAHDGRSQLWRNFALQVLEGFWWFLKHRDVDHVRSVTVSLGRLLFIIFWGALPARVHWRENRNSKKIPNALPKYLEMYV